jgi:flagellum-specific ATP synthase
MRAMSFKEILQTYYEAEDLINIGAYVKGSNPLIDHALSKISDLRSYLKQDMFEKATFNDSVNKLKAIIEKPIMA